MMGVLCAAFAALLGVYCWFEKRNAFGMATALKVALSAMVAIIALCAAVDKATVFCWLMAAGLICAVPADYFLQFIRLNLTKYRLGILCFGAMHVLLLTAFYLTYGLELLSFILCVVMIGVISLFQAKQKWQLGKTKGQLSIYTVLVTLMASKALSIAVFNPAQGTLLLGIGGLCFFISDLFLGIWDYHESKFVYLALNRIIYFAGQLLLALSLY